MQQLTTTVGGLYDGFCGFMEKENRMTEFGLYGLSSAVFVYAFLKRRPITKFTKASDIPNQFIRDKVVQSGFVRKIEPTENGPLLLVNHKPPLNLALTSRALPIKVAGVHIDGNGFSWLQTLATNETIKFLPLSNAGNECEAMVFLIKENRRDLDVGRALIGLGFAKVAPLTPEIQLKMDSNFVSYHKQLKKAESKARSLRKGVWLAVPEPWLRWFVRTKFDSFMFNVKRGEMKLPALVR